MNIVCKLTPNPQGFNGGPGVLVNVRINGQDNGLLMLPLEQITEFEAWLRRGRQKGDTVRFLGRFENIPDKRQMNLFDEPLPD